MHICTYGKSILPLKVNVCNGFIAPRKVPVPLGGLNRPAKSTKR